MTGCPTSHLFLDLDGVLHSTAAPDGEVLAHRPALEDRLRQRRNVGVVITGSRGHSDAGSKEAS